MKIQLGSKRANAISMSLIGREALVKQLIDTHKREDSPINIEYIERYKHELIIIHELIQEIY